MLKFIFLIATAISLFVAAAIEGKAKKKETARFSVSQLLEEIEKRAAGLTYITETDSEVHAWIASRPIDTLTAANFLFATRKPPLTPIETYGYDDFFPRLIIGDPSGGWEVLRDFLQDNLEQTKVFFVKENGANENEYTAYAVGLYQGRVIGIQAFGVRT